MEPRQVVAGVFDSVTVNGSCIKHPRTGLVVSTKRFSHDLWTFILNNTNGDVSTMHAYPATPRGYSVHEVIPGSGNEQRVARALLSEAMDLLNAQEPYVLAGNSEMLHIPSAHSFIADRYRAAVTEQLHGADLREADYIPIFSSSLEAVLLDHMSITDPQREDRQRYLN